MVKRVILFSMLLLSSCAPSGLHKQGPCQNLEGAARAECLGYIPKEFPDTARKAKTDSSYDRVLQGIDRFIDGTIDSLFY